MGLLPAGPKLIEYGGNHRILRLDKVLKLHTINPV
jgi:hypothetical protein